MADGFIEIQGDKGKIKINYDETLNISARTSTITVTSVQVMATEHAGIGHTFYAVGSILINGTIVLTLGGGDKRSTAYVGNIDTYYTLSNSYGDRSITLPNNGSDSRAGFIASEIGGDYVYGQGFIVFCEGGNPGYGDIKVNPNSRSVDLTKYAQGIASNISMPAYVNLGDTTTIKITASDPTYVHYVMYSIDKATWYNMSGVSNVHAGTYIWDTSNIPGDFKKGTLKVCYVRCYTYNSSGIIIGENDTTVTIKVIGSPTIQSLTITPINDNAIIREWNGGNIYVQGYTKANISVDYTVPDWSSLASCRISVNGIILSDGTSTSFTTSTLNEAGTVRVSVTIIDSSGDSSEAYSKEITVYPYSRPYATLTSALRYSTDVNVEDKDNGTNISAKAKMAYSSVNGYNSAGIRVRYKPSNGAYQSTYTTLTSGNANHVKINGDTVLSTEQSYVVQFLVYDSLHSLSSNPTTIEITIPTKSVVIHSKDGGTGIAFGGYNTGNGIEHFWPTFLYDALMIDSGSYGETAPTGTGNNGQVYFQLSSSSSGGGTGGSSGGSAGSNLFIVNESTTYDQVTAALNAGEVVVLLYNNRVFPYSGVTNSKYRFASAFSSYMYYVDLSPDGTWTPGQWSTFSPSHIAPVFSALNTYNVGAYVIYGVALYKCIIAVTEPGAWNASNWKQTTVMEEVSLR